MGCQDEAEPCRPSAAHVAEYPLRRSHGARYDAKRTVGSRATAAQRGAWRADFTTDDLVQLA
jgi:hypothetical protein